MSLGLAALVDHADNVLQRLRRKSDALSGSVFQTLLIRKGGRAGDVDVWASAGPQAGPALPALVQGSGRRQPARPPHPQSAVEPRGGGAGNEGSNYFLDVFSDARRAALVMRTQNASCAH
jgi:hypothetical protein